MNVNKKACPYCGSKLRLTAPDCEKSPQFCGKYMGGTEFCVVGELRLLSYTRRPTGRLSDVEQIKQRCSKGEAVLKAFNKFGKRTKWSNPIRTTDFVRKKIAEGGNSLYEENLPMLCGKCHGKLAVNVNPRRYVYFAYALWTGLLCLSPVILALGAMGIFPWIGILCLLCGCLLLTAIGFLSGFVWLKRIEKYRSNLAPVNEFDDLMSQSLDFSAAADVDQRYIHTTNIFETHIDGREFKIYIESHISGTVDFHVCLHGDELADVKNLLAEKETRKEQIILPLSFEGKEIGNAEILKIHNCN